MFVDLARRSWESLRKLLDCTQYGFWSRLASRPALWRRLCSTCVWGQLGNSHILYRRFLSLSVDTNCLLRNMQSLFDSFSSLTLSSWVRNVYRSLVNYKKKCSRRPLQNLTWYDTTRHDMATHDMTRSDTACHDTTWQHMTWHEATRHANTHDNTWHDMKRNVMTPHNATQHSTTQHSIT